MQDKSNPTSNRKRAPYGRVKRKVLYCLIKYYDLKRSLKAKEIAQLTQTNVNSVKTVLRNLYYQNLVIKTSPGNYILANEKAKQIAKQIIDQDYTQTKRFKLGRVPRSFGNLNPLNVGEFFKRFFDLNSAVFEFGMVKFRVDRYVADKLRSGCSFSRGDRAKQVSFACESFSCVISKHGHIRLHLKNPNTWLRDFVKWLKSKGLDDYNVRYVLSQLLNQGVPNAEVSVEVPIVDERVKSLKESVIETKVGDKVIVSRICASHFPIEMETRGDFDMVGNFLAALAGAQHFSALEYLQAEKLTSIDKKFGIIASKFEELAKALKQLGQKKIEYEIPKPPKEEPKYVT